MWLSYDLTKSIYPLKRGLHDGAYTPVSNKEGISFLSTSIQYIQFNLEYDATYLRFSFL